MSSAYYVGRRELLDWLNTLCATRLTRLEQAGGAEACQVLDALFPGRVPMAKVDWAASQPHEKLQNYKLLQQTFAALQIDKQIPVDGLVRGRSQDNLEFLQWLKAFYDSRTSHAPYDAVARRAKGRGGAQYDKRLGGGVAVPGRTSTSRKKAAAAAPYRRRSSRACSGEDTEATDDVTMLEMQMKSMQIRSKGLVTEKTALVAEKEALEAQVQELQEAHELVESERDFYLKKLEEIEKLVHDVELSKVTSAQSSLLGLSILDVLYATEEDEEELVPF